MTSIPIPDLPACGRPAATRLEIYSPVDGHAHGSLDASAYVCAAHLRPALATLDAAGLVGHQVDTPATANVCGHRFDYTTLTGSETAPAPDAPAQPEHPSWCDPNECTAAGGGAHSSHPTDLVSDGPTDVLSAYLTIEARDRGEATVLLSVLRLEDADGESGVLRLTGRQAIDLGSALRRLGIVTEQHNHPGGAS